MIEEHKSSPDKNVIQQLLKYSTEALRFSAGTWLRQVITFDSADLASPAAFFSLQLFRSVSASMVRWVDQLSVLCLWLVTKKVACDGFRNGNAREVDVWKDTE